MFISAGLHKLVPVNFLLRCKRCKFAQRFTNFGEIFMEYKICTVAAAPVRKEPAHRSEMTSQLLFGETMAVLATEKEWVHIRSLYDHYEGWITHHLAEGIGEGVATESSPFVATALVNPVTLPSELINAPMGSSLTGYDPETRLLWDGQHKYHGTLRFTAHHPDLDLLERTVQPWINAPYLWGGRTFMGVDCSGFTQTVFKVLGKKLQRDAYQQANEGEGVEGLSDAATGDLAFFHNEAGKIVHVGILLDDTRIIHASGKVRIDAIDKTGIVNSSTGQRTHTLHSIRRMIRFVKE
jgi:hypothetical protein